MPTGGSPVRPLDAREGRRLAETVRQLSGDRERLLARLATLAQSVDGITGSIARIEKPAQATEPPLKASVPPTLTPYDDVKSSVNLQARIANSVPMPAQPPGSSVGKTEFSLDLGSASTIEALRTSWTAALRRHCTLLEGLRPVVGMRELSRPGGPDLRLIAGPVANAATAARLWAAMTAAGAVCAPAVFDGQRLAVR